MKQRTNTKLAIITTNLHHGLEEGALNLEPLDNSV